jgi:hypothetical protein
LKAIPITHFVLTCCTFILLPAHAFQEIKPTFSRASSLLNSFEVMCNLQTPDFENLAAQATAMQMIALEDESETTPSAEVIRRRGWVGMLTSGPFALRAEKMSGVRGVSTSCSIEGAVPDADDFRNLVVKQLQLVSAPEIQTIEGSHTYYWDNHLENGTAILVGDIKRPSGPFVRVKLLTMVKKRAP